MTNVQQRQPDRESPRARGPVMWAFILAIGLCSVTLSAWFVGVLIGIGGCYTFWPDSACERRAADLVREDLDYITAAPRSLLVGDTVAFSAQLVATVRLPYEKLGLLRWYLRWHGPQADLDTVPVQGDATNSSRRMARIMAQGIHEISVTLSRWTLITMYVAMDVLLRLSVALYALPAFVLACLIGALDGMVRRDLRRWGGGRESSFVYHHAKHYTVWALTGGFGLYLSWPFGGFNPSYMVLAFTVLVAATLSTTVGAFKKYL
jgi:integrating conjugative element membrane protein (TIGR03747 family)